MCPWRRWFCYSRIKKARSEDKNVTLTLWWVLAVRCSRRPRWCFQVLHIKSVSLHAQCCCLAAALHRVVFCVYLSKISFTTPSPGSPKDSNLLLSETWSSSCISVSHNVYRLILWSRAIQSPVFVRNVPDELLIVIEGWHGIQSSHILP
jgi:hypothetical protein